MTQALSVKWHILATILAMGKTEFEGDIRGAMAELFSRHLELLPEPRYLRDTPKTLTFEDELRSILFHLEAFSWTQRWLNRGSYINRYRIEDLPLLQRIVEEARLQDPETVAKFEALAPELEKELERTVKYRESLVIAHDPNDYP